VASAQWKNNQHMIPSSRVRVQGAGMSEIAIREKMNGTERDRTRLNNNGIGFENTIDYCS